jgi:3-phenylpropionate/trans-cinnamate dioxygenase ferredoxin reductase component
MGAEIRFVIVGGGLAAVQAAQTLRSEGAAGPITLISEEDLLPYLRPPLSKQYLQGQVPRDSVFIHDRAWYDEHSVEVRVDSPAVRIDPDHRIVLLSNGDRVPYDRLLLATGSSARHLDFPGAELEGVLSLRTLGDCERIRSALVAGQRMVIVGAGWIGLEIAAAARNAGLDVTVLEVDEHPLARVLGPTVGALFTDLHSAHGVRILTEEHATEFVEDSGRVAAVRTQRGQVFPADVVIVGVGALPNVDIAIASGIPVSNGVVVDEYLASEVPGLFAAGDVASAFHRRYGHHLRVEHWDNALQQGRTAAVNMLGRRAEYDRLPFFYSDQYDVGLEYSGHAPAGSFDRVILRGDVDTFRFVAFWLDGHRVVAAMNVNTWDVRPHLESLIWSGIEVDSRALADPDTDLTEVSMR